MPLFAVSLLSECHIAGAIPADPMHELAIHIVQARSEVEARVAGEELGVKRQHVYKNSGAEDVSWVFQSVVECQELFEPDLSDGMEVSSWLYKGERLCLNDGWSVDSSEPTELIGRDPRVAGGETSIDRDMYGVPVEPAERMQQVMLGLWDLMDEADQAEFPRPLIDELNSVRSRFMEEFSADIRVTEGDGLSGVKSGASPQQRRQLLARVLRNGLARRTQERLADR